MKIQGLLPYLALLGGAVIWASFYGGTLPFLMLYTVLILPVASGVYLFYAWRSLHFYQKLPTHKATKGEEVPYQLSVENTGILPIVSVAMLLENERCSVKGIGEEVRLSLKPGERVGFTSQMTCLYAGAYEIGVRTFLMEDCFHLFMLRLKAPTDFRVFVRPRITDMAESMMDLEEIRNQVEIPNSRLFENTLGNDLRKYQKGDSLKAIHWKNYARSGQLLVRMPEPKQIRHIHVFLIPKESSQALSDIKLRDRFLEMAVSIADYFCTRNRPVSFHLPKGGMQFVTVDSYGTFREFYDALPDELDGCGSGLGEEDIKSWLEQGRQETEGSLLLLYEGSQEGGDGKGGQLAIW